MLKKREFWILVLVWLVMTLLLMFQNNSLITEKLFFYLLISFTILLVSISAKKILANMLDTEIEMRLWQFSRYWFSKRSHLQKPIPIGILLPLLLSLLSGGIVKLLAFLHFSAEALPSKVTKKYGSRRFSTVTDWDYSLIGFYSLLAVLILAVISSFLANHFYPEFFKELGKIAIYFSICNLLPIHPLDGIKIFMGSRPLYIFSIVLLVVAGLIVLI